MKVPAMARSCYKESYDKREKEYLEVVKRYDKNVFGTYFPQMLADLTRLSLILANTSMGNSSHRLISVNLWRKSLLMRALRKQLQKKVIAELPNRLAAPGRWYWESFNV